MIDLFANRFASLAGVAPQDGVGTLDWINGTSGDDRFRGTGAADAFHLEAGGDDTAKGGGGGDLFYMGASFNRGDHIDGGPNGGHNSHDTIVLDGDYSERVVLKADTLVDVEAMYLTAGHDYRLVLNAAPTSSSLFTVTASSLSEANSVSIDGSRVEATDLKLVGGMGADLLIGGAGNDEIDSYYGADTVEGGGGDDFFTSFYGARLISGGDGDDIVSLQGAPRTWMTIDGGAGTDELGFFSDGSDATIALSPDRITNLEVFYIESAIHLAALPGLAEAGDRLWFQVTRNTGGVSFDASQELHDGFTLLGGESGDTLVGGGGADIIHGGGGANILEGGDGDDHLRGGGLADRLTSGVGADHLVGGAGADAFVFMAVEQSRRGAFDHIVDLSGDDVIALQKIDADTTQDGDQAFHLVGVLSGHAGELALGYDAVRDRTTVLGDIDGDGRADLVVVIDGDWRGFENFAL